MNKVSQALFIGAMLLASLRMNAQPTLTAANYSPVPGDDYRMITCAYSSPGWDFSGIDCSPGVVSIWVEPTTAPGNAQFPGATVALYPPGYQVAQYFTGTAADFTYRGDYYQPPGYPKLCTDPMRQMQFPFTVGSTFSDSFHCDEYGGTAVTRWGTITVTGEAQGTLVLPYGSFPGCLRVLEVQDYQDVYGGQQDTAHVVRNTYYYIVPGTHQPMLTLRSQTYSVAGGSTTTEQSVMLAPSVTLAPKLWLDGAYDQGTGLMRDDLRAAGLVPATEPYSALFGGTGGETVPPAVLAVTGNNAVVDWVRIELRSTPTGPALATANALLQRDGDVVAWNGSSPVKCHVSAGNYHVVVRHRNHLGVMTSSAIALSSSPTTVDLRSPSTSLYVRPAPNTDVPVKSIATQRLLWAGDANTNATVKYTGSGNDRDLILTTVGGNTPNATLSGQYRREDVNLDGVVKYTGTNNDRDRVLVNVGSTTPNNTRIQQVP